jgi:antitoxin component YwqK of YwqJK toxin-antitoxin module
LSTPENELIANEPFTREVSNETGDGTIIIKFVNGKKEGITKFVNKNGTVLSEIGYKNDIIEGVVKQYYPASGALLCSMEYSGGKQNGYFKTYYESGGRQVEAMYKNGERNGAYILYDEFGDKAIECIYKDGLKEGKSITYYPKSSGGGIFEYTEYKNGLIEGNKVALYQTGEVLSVTPYVKGNPQEYTKTYGRKGEPMV